MSAPQQPAQTSEAARKQENRGRTVRWALGVGAALMCAIGLVLLFLLVLVLFIVRGCAGPGCDPRIDPNCSSSRSSGGSFGGYSSGGSHK